MIPIGSLYQLWDQYIDADDPTFGYTPYDFTSVGHTGIAKMSVTRDWGRRESILSIPGADSVLDEYGREPGPQDRRDVTFGFTVWTDGDNDKAYDLLAAQVAPGYPQRLVYKTDSGGLWFTLGSNPRIQHTNTADNRWGKGGECNFSVTWRIRPDWRPRYSETAQIFHSATTFAASTTFGSVGTTVIASANQAFTVDARGTAGFDLPTLPDRGPTLVLTGPVGGDDGIRIYFGSAQVRDTNGALVPMHLDIPFKLPTANDGAILKLAPQRFTHNGLPFRPLKPDYQRGWGEIVAGVLNSGSVVALGANPVSGGSLNVDFWRRRA